MTELARVCVCTRLTTKCTHTCKSRYIQLNNASAMLGPCQKYSFLITVLFCDRMNS